MSSQQVTVKAYLKRGCQRKRLLEQADEIRRFGIDYDVSTSYEYLLAKIVSVFPGLVNMSVTLYWKDSDDDMIAFSSDDELMEAMKSITEGVFRVFIVEKKVHKSDTQTCGDEANMLHPGVTCDGCNGEIRGNRYKCTVCPDYDLCSRCKSTGVHGEHEMRTIERPQWPFCHFGMPFPESPFMGQMPPPHAGPPFMGQMPPPPTGTPFMGQMPPPPAYGCFQPTAGGPDTQGFDPAEARQRNRKAWKRWYKATYGCGRDKHKHKKEKKEKKEKCGGGKSSSSSSSDSETSGSPTGEYLKNIGQSVAAMLDPLGIDVEVDVEHHGQKKKCHRNGMGGRWGWKMHGAPWGMGMRGGHCGPWGGMRGGGRGGWGCHGRRDQFGCDAQAPTCSSSDSQTNLPEKNASGVDIPVAGSEGHQPQNIETRESASGNFSSSPDHDWTVLDNGGIAGDVEFATAGVKDLEMSDGPRDEIMTDIPTDPNIAESLQKMMMMGYSNDGGWLTDLLTFHKGDIGRALDAIHAKK